LDVCSAIQHAHQKGIIHRDIKPSNILVTLHGDKPLPKVIDFGVAKATQGRLTEKTLFTQFQHFIGTPAYMSPEQASLSGLDVDTRSDIYGLGVLLYELLTGKTPFDANELLKAGFDRMAKIIREQEPPKPSTRLSTLEGEDLTSIARCRHTEAPKLIHQVRGDLDWIVMKCLEKDRGRRYETANGLAIDLQHHLADEPVAARPPSALYRIHRAIRRNKVAFTAAVAIAAVLIVASIVSLWQAIRATRAEREAKQQSETARKLKGDIDYDRNLYRDFWLARGYERRSQTNEALALFAKLRPQLAAAFPQHRPDCEEVAKFFVRMRRYDEARAAYEPIRASFEANLPEDPTELQTLIEATAASKGWLAAAEMCRHHFDLLPSEPIAWRSKAITLLYSGDADGYAKAAAAAISLANAATNWEDLIAILETASLGPMSLSTEQTNLLNLALQRIADHLTPEREEAGRAARAGVFLRLGRFHECIRQTKSALAWKYDRMGPARVCALGALCRYYLRDAEMAYANFVTGDSYTQFTPLWNLEALGESERFLTEAERYFLILRREELATIPGARVDALARQSRLKEAAAEAALGIEREPTNVWHYAGLAALLAAQQDLNGYRGLCRKITVQFKGTEDPKIAEFLAKACLILPASTADPAVLNALVEAQGTNSVFAWFTRGLNEYREGNFAAATNWTQRAIDYAASYGGEYGYVEARMVSAMAHYQLQSTNESRRILAEGLRLAQLQKNDQAPGDLGYDWRARLRDEALIKEARALIESK
jgi:hypothetical protein